MINTNTLPKLPANLSLMNFKEIIDVAKLVLKRDHFEQGKTGMDIKYGLEDWTPSSTIWDLEQVPWIEITKNFKDMKNFPAAYFTKRFARALYLESQIDQLHLPITLVSFA